MRGKVGAGGADVCRQQVVRHCCLSGPAGLGTSTVLRSHVVTGCHLPFYLRRVETGIKPGKKAVSTALAFLETFAKRELRSFHPVGRLLGFTFSILLKKGWGACKQSAHQIERKMPGQRASWLDCSPEPGPGAMQAGSVQCCLPHAPRTCQHLTACVSASARGSICLHVCQHLHASASVCHMHHARASQPANECGQQPPPQPVSTARSAQPLTALLAGRQVISHHSRRRSSPSSWSPPCWLAGKSFFKKKKQPIPVRITVGDWGAMVDQALSGTYLYPAPGNCVSIK